MLRLSRLAFVVASNAFLTMAIIANLIGQFQIVDLRINTTVVRTKISIDDTGLIVTRSVSRHLPVFSVDTRRFQHRRWDHLFGTPDHSWRNSAFAYHDAYMGQLSGVTVVGQPRHGVTHLFLILLSVICSIFACYQSVCKIAGILFNLHGRPPVSASPSQSSPKPAG